MKKKKNRKCVLFYLGNIAAIRSMSKNVFDGLFFLTNDVKNVEQTQALILQKLDRIESRVCDTHCNVRTYSNIPI